MRIRKGPKIPCYEKIPKLRPDDIGWKFTGWTRLRKKIKSSRLLWFSGTITHRKAGSLIASIIYLSVQEPEFPIYVVINSWGGHAPSALAVVGIMKTVVAPVHTACMGEAISMAAMMLIGGGRMGGRTIYPGSKLLLRRLHMKEPNVREYDDTPPFKEEIDLLFDYKVMQELEDSVLDAIASQTSYSMERIGEFMDKSELMSAKEVVRLGLVDQIGTKQTLNTMCYDTMGRHLPSFTERRRLHRLMREQALEEERRRYYTEPRDSGGGDGGAEMEPA
uniref:ATP-dependent Clp protease proteolytic subunit n=1 Tax=Drosera peltata TaxID=4369 RepID=A0A8F3FP62_DROPA|nr:clp protease proteolytic subunit [Drosera peltata]